jgi:hypothetical protein
MWVLSGPVQGLHPAMMRCEAGLINSC